ncbi:probable low-specificity L-threonine aldolase 1 isoform X3 [Mesocricetus auratus]|uniref:Probable low-specificity L-threonine aldolase 1 isoform X3 n=1 Tax=Mesocricetus auratus TaxID=10036 RepID=A0ABM2XTN3_MESAU|nr:probable low-specificity L-threonine aldolase 1 isoform X3 [Mesocricetus auratus]
MLRRLARAAVPGSRAPWARWSRNWAGVPAQVVDLRSDTVTRPGPAMRRAMAQAVVGDDDYGEDPTVHVMGHCRRRGSQVLLGQECHLHVYEQGGVAQIAGVHSQPLPDMPHGTLDLDELERALTRGFGSSYHPVCELVCLENTHSSAGGRVLPIDYLRQVRLLAHTHGARVHLDGARLMNAAVALRVPPARLVEHCDSVSFCLSKGLGAPVGALVGGSRDFIEEAWRLRKALGGGMRQAGVLAAAALVGLAEAEEVLPKDHENAQRTPGPGITRLLCGPCHRGDQHSAGAGVWAASRRAVPAPAGCERRRGGSDWLCRERVAVSLDGALRAGCVAPRRIRSGHRTGPEEVGVCAEAVAALRRRDPGVRRPG